MQMRGAPHARQVEISGNYKRGLKAGKAAVAVGAVNSSAACITILTDRQSENLTHAHTALLCLNSTNLCFEESVYAH